MNAFASAISVGGSLSIYLFTSALDRNKNMAGASPGCNSLNLRRFVSSSRIITSIDVCKAVSRFQNPNRGIADKCMTNAHFVDPGYILLEVFQVVKVEVMHRVDAQPKFFSTF